ncbi:PIG-L deacetylase family protein [Aquabacter sp. CN5-332]|uniref:PIG-L deacetylase family protein n=1 Tax=Aquabacter sp. CN5-332 TaxID=3156608 RepID=UPI0032B5A0E7
MEHLPFLSFEEIGARSIAIIAPHPDDESLGCGGLIRAARDRGVPVCIIILSDGTGSHPGSPSYPPERLKTLRETEARLAASALGVPSDNVHFLRLPDRFVPGDGPAAEAVVEILVKILRLTESDFIAVTWDEDPHCDHKAAAALARAACAALPARLFAYPIWGRTLSPDAPVTAVTRKGFRLRIDNELPAKRAAISAHLSQTTDLIADDPNGFRLTPDLLALFEVPYEIYVEQGA